MARIEPFIKIISNYHNIMLDSNAIIYFLDGTPVFFEFMQGFFELLEQGRLKATISVISEAELLVKPYRENNSSAIEAVNFFLEEFPNLKICPVSREISRQAAKIRAKSDIRLPDAIILATAVHNNCDLMLGNDLKLMYKAKPYLPVIILNEYV
ncbi:MAG: PIN domain-containing protein [Syntrophomonadaceae bacterium]|nr:PIN domain-containing protein [Syntrophomonadaceae bacterium]